MNRRFLLGDIGNLGGIWAPISADPPSDIVDFASEIHEQFVEQVEFFVSVVCCFCPCFVEAEVFVASFRALLLA